MLISVFMRADPRILITVTMWWLYGRQIPRLIAGKLKVSGFYSVSVMSVVFALLQHRLLFSITWDSCTYRKLLILRSLLL